MNIVKIGIQLNRIQSDLLLELNKGTGPRQANVRRFPPGNRRAAG